MMMLKSYTVVRKKTVDKKCFKLFTSSTFTNGRLIHNGTYLKLTLTLTITLTLVTLTVTVSGNPNPNNPTKYRCE